MTKYQNEWNALIPISKKRSVFIVVLMFLQSVIAFGQDVDAYTDNEQPDALIDADDLDSLLEAAEADISQLTTVSVTAPALQMEVTSVSRQVSTVGKSAAAVFVITNEMVRRSGARNIPDALRMAPGVQVARLDSNKWAVGIRGFSGRFANKLLVQIDGRSVYSPLFAGVFWDVQDVVLEDVERIEVIRGPGATVWGANAVNGIINIITKKSSDTQGVFAQGGAGTEELGFLTARYGGKLSDNAHYRVYGKWFERDEGYVASDVGHDDWRMGRGGFRLDWEPTDCDTITLQGDYYGGMTGRQNAYPAPVAPTYSSIVNDDAQVTGGNGLFRWSRQLSDESDWSIQTYFDHTEREWLAAGFQEIRDTVDVDYQLRFAVGQNHSVICGAGYRNSHGRFRGVPNVISITDDTRDDNLFSCFVQDQITLQDERLFLTLGSKFEHNDYTGFEIQPTARLLWTPSERHSIWGAVSRAVRTPSWVDHEIRLTVPYNLGPPVISQTILGNPNLKSETVMAYEAGIRVQETESFSWDLACFYNEYKDLREYVPVSLDTSGIPFLLEAQFQSLDVAQSIGFELASTYQVNPCWKLQAAYSYIDFVGTNSIERAAGADGGDARNIVFLQSSWDVGHDLEFDLIWRSMDTLDGNISIPAYNVADARIAWHPNNHWEASLVGRNLLNSRHLEFSDPFLANTATQVESEIYGMMTYRY